jgi:nanoRNase/pAp phosphatase (c-di-AMP/oligoRNAs hydrolase)
MFEKYMQPKLIIGFEPGPPGELPLKYALLDSDFDGCVCGAILLCVYPHLALTFADPISVQAGKFAEIVNKETVVADLPYIEGCGIWFDHHFGNIPKHTNFPGICGNIPSAAQIVYNYYKDVADLSKFPKTILELGKFDYALLTLAEVITPNDYVRVGFALNRKDVEFNEYFTRLLASKSWEAAMFEPRVIEKLRGAEVLQGQYTNYLKEHTEVLDNIAFVDNREFVGQASHSLFVYKVFPQVDGVVMISNGNGVIKFSMYRNNLADAAKDIDFLAIARVMNPVASGGHKGGCGFSLVNTMSVEDAKDKILEILNTL